MNAELQPVRGETEIARLAETANEIWHEYFPFLLSAEQLDYMVERFQSVPAITRQITCEGYAYYLLLQNGQAAGYFGCRAEGNRMFLSKLYVKKAFRGQGLGKRMLGFLFDLASRQGAQSVYLTVNRRNQSSIAVYQKMGLPSYSPVCLHSPV